MGKEKITVTLNHETVARLNTLARQRKSKRSHLVEEALQLWEEKQIEQEMAAGYMAMAEEDRTLAEANLSAGFEVLKKP